ncbi:hypothetical protein N0V83_004509 [Neocucurbitaria cava]|uniref:Uncharacterized protein n=1 Tax=Neocucurbitaria cava TaxID=798079 RepID=A0A9W8Y9B2_9PLEO|nr:hypothetical protein N0V83_004509 [Neocucurbitaria cava]
MPTPTNIDSSLSPPHLDIEDTTDVVDTSPLPTLSAAAPEAQSELNHVDSIKYFRSSTCDGSLIPGTDNGVTRRQAHSFLYHYACLKRHLTANLAILQQYGEDGLSVTTTSPTDHDADTLSPLETAQNSFAIHHIGISETLLSSMPHNPALPSNQDFRISRNFFAHDFGTPKEEWDAERNLETQVKGKTALYENLLKVVEANRTLLEEQLADKSMWRELVLPEQTTAVVSWGAWGTTRDQEGMVYEPQFELPPYEEEALQGPGCLISSFSFLFSRSRFVRNVSERVNRCIQTARNEFYWDALDSEVGTGEEWNAERETESEEEGVAEAEADAEVVEDEEEDEPVDEEDGPVYHW